jgi:hypothetical protein
MVHTEPLEDFDSSGIIIAKEIELKEKTNTGGSVEPRNTGRERIFKQVDISVFGDIDFAAISKSADSKTEKDIHQTDKTTETSNSFKRKAFHLSERFTQLVNGQYFDKPKKLWGELKLLKEEAEFFSTQDSYDYVSEIDHQLLFMENQKKQYLQKFAW